MAVKALSKMGLKELGFLSKSSNFVHFEPYDLVQISQACSPNMYQIWRDFRLAVLTFATVAWKSFKVY